MTFLHLHPLLHRPSNTRSATTLRPGQPVHTLVIARGHTVELKAAAGSIWLTCDGAIEDWFLHAGGQLAVQGPAYLRLGTAHLHLIAELEWHIHQPPPARKRLATIWHGWCGRYRDAFSAAS